MQRFCIVFALTRFDGRICRTEFWVGIVVLGLIFHATEMALAGLRGGPLTAGDGLTLIAVAVWPLVALAAKRCHDRGKSAWWCLMMLIPVFGLTWLLIELGLVPGEPQANAYGPEPAARLRAGDAA